ncbi:CACTA en-spm transposon protein [Cucumis melo var. makuwa]|uniref:CACTA en-spm transposon protein n=1 Tax=Cucumis melo var. makuwa TaxID=1194695 RepID=A0A5D3CKA8_CUCMM|nr:CACTA en-spm transposon protein [Cucumis melo var. makuwa]TYK11594.1 CACTA en-spm transposon protein [Cucumis melo var. makuwa]
MADMYSRCIMHGIEASVENKGHSRRYYGASAKPRRIMSYQRNNFLGTDAIFLEFEDDLDNLAGGSSSVGDNAGRLLNHLRLLLLGDRFFVLDFNDQAMNRFVEHHMLTIFKEFRADYHRHFKKYSDPEEARANPPNLLEQSQTNKAARQKQPYNYSRGSKLFLQRQHKLAEKKGELVDRVELFWETHVRAGTFVSQAAKDVHNQVLELQSQPTPEGSQPLSRDEIYDQMLGRRPGYSKGLGWGPKPKACKTMSASSSTTSCSQSATEREIKYKLNLIKLCNGLNCKIEITKC